MVFAFAGSVALIVLSVLKPSQVWVVLGPVAMTFGIIGVILSAVDLFEMMFPPTDRLHWWHAHMIGMIASYIAAVSAFSVNNFRFFSSACAVVMALGHWCSGDIHLGGPL